MSNLNQKQLMEILHNLKLAAEKSKKIKEYENNTSINQYCLDLRKEGINYQKK